MLRRPAAEVVLRNSLLQLFFRVLRHTDGVSARPRVVVIEDDQGVRESLGMVLEYQEYDVTLAARGESGLDAIGERRPELVILDLNLPGIDGVEMCRRLRAAGDPTPVLMLTARHETAHRVAGLDAGADDYLVKPFALDELLARVRALLRRPGVTLSAESSGALRVDDLTLDPSTRQVRRGASQIELTRYEFDLLELFMSESNVVLRRAVLYERVWGYDADLSSNSLEVFVSSLRRKTEAGGGPRLIHTMRGVGYVMRSLSR